MMLTAMVLRDYLNLKVEIEGTSGEGSTLVKSFRSLVVSLLRPIFLALCEDTTVQAGQQPLGGPINEAEIARMMSTDEFEQALVLVYSAPETYSLLYAYVKSLEAVESALLGGFYYKHFMLASNVIGSQAKGTMNKSVQALRATYETACFPILDRLAAGPLLLDSSCS